MKKQPSSVELDLDTYFRRIGFTGTPRTDLATLQALSTRHLEAIPFESLNPYLGRPVRLDVPSIYQKLVERGRGGYCFEQNGLFAAVLRQLGFRVDTLGARVIWEADPDRITAETHQVLLVHLDGQRYLVDVGFGRTSLVAPVRLETGLIQSNSHGSYRLSTYPDTDEYYLETLTGDDWTVMYRFTLAPRYPIDYVVANWYVSTHPDSSFTHQLSLARVFPKGRYTLKGKTFTTHYLTGSRDRREINTGAELREVLTGAFGINLEGLDEIGEKFAQSV